MRALVGTGVIPRSIRRESRTHGFTPEAHGFKPKPTAMGCELEEVGSGFWAVGETAW